jgi:hypothetical protein
VDVRGDTRLIDQFAACCVAGLVEEKRTVVVASRLPIRASSASTHSV